MFIASFLPRCVLIIFLLYTTWRTIVSMYARKRRSALISTHNCRPPPASMNQGLLGLNQVREMKEAFKTQGLLSWTCSQHELYGHTYSSKYLTQSIVHTIEPENIRTVLATNFSHYGIGWRRKQAFAPLLGDSLFQLDGLPWARSRSILKPAFSHAQVDTLSAIEPAVDGLIQNVKISSGGGKAVNLTPMFNRLAAQLSMSFIQGSAHDEGGITNDEFLDAMHNSGRGCEERWQQGLFNMFTSQQAYYRNVKEVHRYLDKRIDNALLHGATSSDFLTTLAKQTKNRKVLRDEACMLFIAGSDAMSCLLTNLFFLICRDISIWAKLREEIQYLEGQCPKMLDLRRLRYHTFCIQETLRLLPVLPSDSRVANRDTVLPVGGGNDGKSPIFVPSGSMVSFSIMALHRRTDLWGESSSAFVPERWEGLKPGWQYVPFLKGPRICLGHELAMNEALYILVRFVQNFETLHRSDDDPWIENISIGTTSANGVTVTTHATQPIS